MTRYHHKGRGAVSSPPGRFETRAVEATPGEAAEQARRSPETVLRPVRARRIISRNSSPDVPFDRSINPYQGCEHGCIYCYARPSHSYLDLSPGLDFETRIFYKPNATERLCAEWAKPGYRCQPITIGANTDPYQPAEKSRRVTRGLLELFQQHRHPVNIITKGTLIRRDVDLLGELAGRGLCSVTVSLPTLDTALKRIMEPRVPSAAARLGLITDLVGAGIPTSVLVAPIIPAINDAGIERVIEAVAGAGAYAASYVFLRLPHELKTLFADWLEVHFPQRAGHVMSLVRQASGGRDYDNRFGLRQRGQGAYADMIRFRFRAACKRSGLENDHRRASLDCTQFIAPRAAQLGLDLGYS